MLIGLLKLYQVVEMYADKEIIERDDWFSRKYSILLSFVRQKQYFPSNTNIQKFFLLMPLAIAGLKFKKVYFNFMW